MKNYCYWKVYSFDRWGNRKEKQIKSFVYAGRNGYHYIKHNKMYCEVVEDYAYVNGKDVPQGTWHKVGFWTQNNFFKCPLTISY